MSNVSGVRGIVVPLYNSRYSRHAGVLSEFCKMLTMTGYYNKKMNLVVMIGAGLISIP